MSDLKVKDFVFEGNDAIFHMYRSGFLYYTVVNQSQDELYMFPIPLEDTGNATFSLRVKAITLMRWIRKSIEDKTMVKI